MTGNERPRDGAHSAATVVPYVLDGPPGTASALHVADPLGGVDDPGVRLAVAVAAVAGASDARTALAAALTGTAAVLEQGWAAVVEDGRVLAGAGAVPKGLPTPPAGHRHAVLALPDGLALHAGRPGAFDATDEVFLEAIGGALVLALHRGVVGSVESPSAEPRAAAARRHPAVDELMAQVQRAVAERQPLQAVLDAVTAGASALFGGALVQLRVPADGGGPMHVLAGTGAGADAIDAGTTSGTLVEELCRRVVEGGRVRVAATIDRPDGTAPGVSVLAAPVHEQGYVRGSLLVCAREPGRRFDERERDVVLALAGLASLALVNAHTVEELQQAFHDPLTRLPNRSLFLDRLEHACDVAERSGARLALLFIDLDAFKRVNESLGHATGDEVLSVVADRLHGCLRETDTAARLGGDEFAVLVERIGDVGEATRVAGRILDALRGPIAVGGADLTVGASIGIALGGGEGAHRHLLRDADLAMHRAKEEGKGRWLVFEASMHRTVMERVDLEADLRRAVDAHEFVVHYQPVVRLANERVVGFEALVRWAHPRRGLLAPANFVPAAEDNGLILDIGRQVLRTACATLATWQARQPGPPLIMSVNLSVRQLAEEGLAGEVAGVLAETGVRPESLMLEITETMLMADLRTCSQRLRELKRLGVRLAIDDFGTGYSSLGYLRDFRFDLLKLDESFISELPTSPEAASLVRKILEIGDTLRLRTLAEGIESRNQLVQLRAMGCELGQGFLFSRALSAAEVERTLGAGGPARQRPGPRSVAEGLPVGSGR